MRFQQLRCDGKFAAVHIVKDEVENGLRIVPAIMEKGIPIIAVEAAFPTRPEIERIL